MGKALEERVNELEQENKKLRRDKRRLMSIVNAGYNIDIELAKNPHYEDAILEMIVREAKRLLNVKQCAILLIDEKDNVLRTKETSGLPKQWSDFEIKLGESISGKVAKTGKPIVVYDRLKDSRTKYAMAGKNVRGFASVPISNRRETLGVLNVYKNVPYKFSKDEIKYLSMLASKSAIAIEIARMHKKVHDAYMSFNKSVGILMEAKSLSTFNHSANVALLAKGICDEMGLDDEEKELIVYAAELHDIGKVNIPDGILSKPGRLGKDEMYKMKSHPRIGRAIIEKSPFPFAEEIAYIVYCHHEDMDGGGYYGLNARKIPLGAMIIRVADSFDAMTAGNRPWKKSMSSEKALRELRKDCVTKYNTRVFYALKRVLNKNHPPGTQP